MCRLTWKPERGISDAGLGARLILCLLLNVVVDFCMSPQCADDVIIMWIKLTVLIVNDSNGIWEQNLSKWIPLRRGGLK